jgi:predicted TIM-barrel fold metal-dependent hydrolase
VIIDSHVHIGGPDKGDRKSLFPEALIAEMDRLGIDKAVVFPFNDTDQGKTFFNSNLRVAEYARKHEDRIIGFCRLDPNEGEKAIDELIRSIELGLSGVKLHPKAQDFTPENPWVLKIIKSAALFGVPVVFDTGKEIFPNSAIAKLAGEVADANIILAHMRGEGFIEAAEEHENVYLGTVKVMDLKIIENAISRLGPEKIIAGSDYPYVPMDYEMIGKFDDIGLSGRERELVAGENIERILGL